MQKKNDESFLKIDGIWTGVGILNELEIGGRETERLEHHVAELFELSHHFGLELLVPLLDSFLKLLFVDENAI